MLAQADNNLLVVILSCPRGHHHVGIVVLVPRGEHHARLGRGHQCLACAKVLAAFYGLHILILHVFVNVLIVLLTAACQDAQPQQNRKYTSCETHKKFVIIRDNSCSKT